jgi:sialidase-1
MIRFALTLLFCWTFSVTVAHCEPPNKVAVFTSEQEGYQVCRIPAIVVSSKGTLLAFCEGRHNNMFDFGAIDTVLKRSFDGGKTWGPMQLVWDDGPNTCGNPTPVVDRDAGTIWLFMCRNDGIPGTDAESHNKHFEKINSGKMRDPRTVWVCKSNDDGAIWSKPIEITSAVKRPNWNWFGTGPCNGIQTRSGRLVVPSNYSALDEKDGERFNLFPNVIYSDDHGKTWQTGGNAGDNAGESTVAELSDGSLMINVRNYPHLTGARGVAVSKDGGLTWSEPWIDKTLFDSCCQANLLSYTTKPEFTKNRLLFSNPVSLEHPREKMTVRLSYDDGKTWPVAKLIHAGPSAYSNLVVLPDMSIGCLYECGDGDPYATITFAHFTLDWLTDGKDSLQRAQ